MMEMKIRSENPVPATKNNPERSIEYYPLSKREYKDLKWEQILNKIKSQLKEFIKTEKLKNSSLAKAITIGFDDGGLVGYVAKGDEVYFFVNYVQTNNLKHTQIIDSQKEIVFKI